MPFLKTRNYRVPLSRQKERMTWKSGLRHAIFTVPGDRYKGEWMLDKKEGKGTELTRKGKQYEGDWEQGYKHGFGILSRRLPNLTFETCYVGDWQYGEMHGVGISYYPDGSYYEGEFKNSKRDGHGRMWFADDGYYEGRWKGDKFHGMGIYVQPNINRYEGEWYNGVKQGRGIFYHLDNGQKQQGVWVNGIAKCSTMIDIYYRQSGCPPTEYPIQVNELQDPESVHSDAEKSVMEHIEHMKPSTFETTIRALRILVWADQVTPWS